MTDQGHDRGHPTRGHRRAGVAAGAVALLVAAGTGLATTAVGADASAAAQTSGPLTNPGTGLRAGVTPLTTSPGQYSRAAAPLGAHLTYYGGRVISNVQVVQVLYGSGSYEPHVQATTTPSLATFYQQATNSSYWDWLTEYNTTTQPGTRTNQQVGRGSFLEQVQITPAPQNDGGTIDDTNIQAEIAAQIHSGTLPIPTHDAAGNPNTIYALFFPHGKSITMGGSSSCVAGGFAGYHGTIANVAGAGEIYYAVQPDFQAGSGCDTGTGGGTTFQNETSVASHELAEATTDAEVGLATVVGPPVAWYDNSNGEIGDICNAMEASITGGDGQIYTVQDLFSNAQGNCVISGANFSLSLTPATEVIARGQSGVYTVSTALVSGAGQSISLSISGLPAHVSGSFTPSTISAGSSSTLTLNVAANAPTTTASFTVTGTGTSATHSATASLTIPGPLTVSPTSGPPQTPVTLNGAGFRPGETVKVLYKTGLASPSPAGVLLCSATVASDGTFSCSGAIPAAPKAGATGAHSIVAKGLTSRKVAKTTYTLT